MSARWCSPLSAVTTESLRTASLEELERLNHALRNEIGRRRAAGQPPSNVISLVDRAMAMTGRRAHGEEP